MTESPLFVFKEMSLIRSGLQPTICSNWYISSWNNQRILMITQKMLFQYWEKAECLDNYFMFRIFLAMAARKYSEDWSCIPCYNNHAPHTLQFELNDTFDSNRWDQLLGMSPIHKLNHHIEYGADENNFYHYILERWLHDEIPIICLQSY